MPQSILILAEHDDGRLKLATLAAVKCAQQLCADVGGQFEVLVLGASVAPIVESLRRFGAANVLVADHPSLQHPVADKYAHLVAETAKARGATLVCAAASTYSKDILPRAAAQLDAGMLGDVISIVPTGDDFTFDRVLYAGNAIATVTLSGPVRVLTVRPAAYGAPSETDTLSPVTPLAITAESLPDTITYVSREEKPAGRPDATEARIVVSGGRAIKSGEDFERLVGGLADVLHGAVGSSRALVDSGITPNALQVGQTGKIVAPDLYIALGISGAIQHLAGMKDTRTIVAINQDADAPIFEVADYGLVGDVYQIVPELIQKLKPA